MGVLLMLLTIVGSLLAVLLMILAGITRQVWLARFVFGAAGVWLAIYVALLATFSCLSREKTLELNEPKAFCGFYLDCHLHAAVTAIEKTKTFNDKAARGEFYVVKIKISNDARRAAMNLWNPQFVAVDAANRKFERLAELENPAPAWEQKIPAGGSFEKEIIFDLPADVQNPRLDISEGLGIDKMIEAVLINDEDSLWHKRAFFRLESVNQTTSLQ